MLKSLNEILEPDLRFATLCVVHAGIARAMTLEDHHSSVAEIVVGPNAPIDVQDAFDRARNAYIYAFFSYELMVVAELQALGAFELALKERLKSLGLPTRGTLRNLIDRARRADVLPPVRADSLLEPYEALLAIRNSLAHGTVRVHTVGMALGVFEACAHAISALFASRPA